MRCVRWWAVAKWLRSVPSWPPRVADNLGTNLVKVIEVFIRRWRNSPYSFLSSRRGRRLTGYIGNGYRAFKQTPVLPFNVGVAIVADL